MDTSEIYIKMCDYLEIQGQKPKGNEFSISYKDSGILIEHEGHFFFKGEIWLPRQDQIQAMLFEEDFSPLRTLHVYGHSKYFQYMGSRIASFRNEAGEIWNYFIELTSMEQLWLAFYMYEKHGKKWNGNKWMKE